uniref:Protein tyrosine phosphatase 4A1 n=1 Tax=Salarias fasciatus TaxID=181472 RepID=A0A672GDI6_SALFA
MARMNRPAPVEITYKNMRFLITHNPTNATLNKFIEELKKYGVTTVGPSVVRPPTTPPLVVKEGIQVLDWPFDDGAPPSNQIVDDWLNLLKLKFREEPGCCIAVHCVAGLGRAPVLVALALIECGMKYEDRCPVHPTEASRSLQQQAALLPGEVSSKDAPALQRFQRPSQ